MDGERVATPLALTSEEVHIAPTWGNLPALKKGKKVRGVGGREGFSGGGSGEHNEVRCLTKGGKKRDWAG